MAICQYALESMLSRLRAAYPEVQHPGGTRCQTTSTYKRALEEAGMQDDDVKSAVLRHLVTGKCFPTPAHLVEAFEELNYKTHPVN